MRSNSLFSCAEEDIQEVEQLTAEPQNRELIANVVYGKVRRRLSEHHPLVVRL
jgi:hypothetical protein